MHLIYLTFHLINLTLIITIVSVLGQDLSSVPSISNFSKAFQYKHSLKSPSLAQKDGSIPFWEKFGHALISSDNIRVTPSLKSQRGSIWNKIKTDFDWWIVEVTFMITGRGRMGGDGLAFWYVEEMISGEQSDGSVFGGPDLWKGLGIFFDSYDNDAKQNNPYVMAILNNGSLQFDHSRDGAGQQLGGCLKDYRNKPFHVKARIQYHQNTLSVYLTNGMSNGETEAEFDLCLQVEGLKLPQNGYFGISAATGGLADDHDLEKFLVWSLQEKTPEIISTNPKEESESEKYEHEYQGYQEKFDKQKEEYKKEHSEGNNTENNGEYEETPEEEQDEYDLELQEIFKEQGKLKTLARELLEKLDNALGNHETISVHVNNLKPALGGRVIDPNSAMQGQGRNVLQRYEVENLLSSNTEVRKINMEIKDMIRVMDVTLKLQENKRQAEIPGIPSTSTTAQEIQQLRIQVDEIVAEVSKISSSNLIQKSDAPPCPTPLCISSTSFVIFNCSILLIFISYLLYKDKHDFSVKKFY